jgi:titin
VRGLVIENFPGEGIYLNNAGGDTVSGNFLGTDVSGKVAAGNAGGVFASNAGLNKIGGPAVGDRNVISGNNGGGIFLFSDGNTVQNNFIGADASALAHLGNAFGIEVHGSNNLIGGGSPGEGNVITGNLDDGCFISLPSSAFNHVDGNQITFNQGNGVGIYNGAHDNVFGSSAPGAPVNDISSNKLDGVHFDGGTANFVSGDNSISANGGLGIQLLKNANNNQAAPVLASAVSGGGQTIVTGTLTSTPNTTFTVNFWSNPPSDPGEGKVFLGSISVTTDPGGNASFTAHFATALAAGDTVTATAAAGSGTSAISTPVTATVLPGPVDVTSLVSIQRGKLRHVGALYRQRITLHNSGAPLQGPLYLVVDQLTHKVRLLHRAGRTLHAAPLGSSYMLVSLNNNQLGTGATRTVVLIFANPLGRKIHYNLRVLDGAGLP